MVALDAALAAIEETPESWGTWRANPRFRRFLVPRFPYVVFFQVVEGDVRIVAVAHAKRRPGYWANR